MRIAGCVVCAMSLLALGAHAAAASGTASPTRREFIFTRAPFASSHASTVVELRDGSFLAAWFGGTAEGAPDVAIWSARRRAGRWSTVRELAREPHVACWNPVLFHTHDGRLWLYYKFGPNVGSWTGARRWSVDEGRTWSPPEHLAAGWYGPIRAKPLVLDDGTVVSGSSVESYLSWAVWIERSNDGGRSFVRIGPVDVPRRYDRPRSDEARFGIIQPSIVARTRTHLRLYARPTVRIGRICVSDSYDAGRSWMPARPIDVPNPNAALDAIVLRDGRTILVFDDSRSVRTPLIAAVSADGLHFRRFAVLASGAGEYSYPALIQSRDGDLVVTYTWRRKRIAFAQLRLRDVPALGANVTGARTST